MSAITAEPALRPARVRGGWRRFARRNPTIVAGGAILTVIALLAIFAPLFAGDAITMQPAQRLRTRQDHPSSTCAIDGVHEQR